MMALGEHYDCNMRLTREYIHELCNNNEVYRWSYNYTYLIFPRKGVAIACNYDDAPDGIAEYDINRQDIENEVLPAPDTHFQLIKTESCVHSLYDAGGRGNFLFILGERYMYYYDFIDGRDTLHLKSFCSLRIVDVSQSGNRNVIVLGENDRIRGKNYIFEYVRKSED
jgi:hypothetical protein